MRNTCCKLLSGVFILTVFPTPFSSLWMSRVKSVELACQIVLMGKGNLEGERTKDWQWAAIFWNLIRKPGTCVYIYIYYIYIYIYIIYIIPFYLTVQKKWIWIIFFHSYIFLFGRKDPTLFTYVRKECELPLLSDCNTLHKSPSLKLFEPHSLRCLWRPH